jgi:mannosyltransferase
MRSVSSCNETKTWSLHEILRKFSSSLISVRNAIINDLYLQILLLLTFIGLCLRLYHLGDVSIWLDEWLTSFYSSQSFYHIWVICTTTSPHPPLFYWLEHIMLKLGNNEVILRLVSVIAGTLTIPAIYYAGKQFYNKDIGVISAALLTFSTFHILYSQEARSYVLLLFFFVIALIFFLKCFRTNAIKYWLIFGIFSALTCWTHYFGIIPIGTLFLYAFLHRLVTYKGKTSNIKPVLLSGVVALLLSAPLFIMTIRSFSSKINSPSMWGLQGYDLIFSTIRDMLGPGDLKGLVLGIFLIIGLIYILSIRPEKFVFLAFLISVPFCVTYYFSFQIPMVSRYLIFMLPFFFISISFFFLAFHNYLKKPYFPIIVLIIIAVMCLPSLHAYYSLDSKNGENWRSASTAIKDIAVPGDAVVIIPEFYSNPFNYYYNNQSENTYVFNANNLSEFEKIMTANNGRSVFIIAVNPDLFTGSHESIGWIREHFILKYKEGAISIYNAR